jgi:hypothetical protein
LGTDKPNFTRRAYKPHGSGTHDGGILDNVTGNTVGGLFKKRGWSPFRPSAFHLPPSARGFQRWSKDHMLYNMVMARRQVLVQLDDDLVSALDQIAKERDTNRSELLRRAARLLVDAVDEQKADAELIEAYRKQPQDPAWIDALMRTSLENWPEW